MQIAGPDVSCESFGGALREFSVHAVRLNGKVHGVRMILREWCESVAREYSVKQSFIYHHPPPPLHAGPGTTTAPAHQAPVPGTIHQSRMSNKYENPSCRIPCTPYVT